MRQVNFYEQRRGAKRKGAGAGIPVFIAVLGAAATGVFIAPLWLNGVSPHLGRRTVYTTIQVDSGRTKGYRTTVQTPDELADAIRRSTEKMERLQREAMEQALSSGPRDGSVRLHRGPNHAVTSVTILNGQAGRGGEIVIPIPTPHPHH